MIIVIVAGRFPNRTARCRDSAMYRSPGQGHSSVLLGYPKSLLRGLDRSIYFVISTYYWFIIILAKKPRTWDVRLYKFTYVLLCCYYYMKTRKIVRTMYKKCRKMSCTFAKFIRQNASGHFPRFTMIVSSFIIKYLSSSPSYRSLRW